MDTIAVGIMDALKDGETTGFDGENLRTLLADAPAPLERPDKGHRAWHDWQMPQIRHQPLHMLRLDGNDGELLLVGPDGPIGRCTHGLLTGIAEYATFPSEFVEKLSPRLACAVVNERIQRAPAMETAMVLHDHEVMRLTEGSRGIVPASTLAEFVDDWALETFGSSQIHSASYDGRTMRLWVNVPVERPITPAVGDVIQAGFVVMQEYGEPIAVSLGTTRLICTNGATASRDVYSWRCKDARDVDSQLAWVHGALDDCFKAFLPLTERARMMAETRFSGDYHAVLRNASRAMRLPGRYVPELIQAFEQEPGDTQWALVNAFTRLATHHNMPDRIRDAVQHAAGDWTANFQLVTAELPRPMATLVGARILEAA